MPAKITKRVVDALEPGAIIADTEIKGFVARRLPSGVVSYGYRYRSKSGKQRWLPLGLHGAITPDEARGLAKRAAGDVAHGRDPQAERASARAAAANTVDKVLDDYLARNVGARKLRSAGAVASMFTRLVRPQFGERSIYTLGRQDILDLLDVIEDDNGPVMADRTLSNLRAAFNWYSIRDPKFNSPIIPGMARTKTSERARSRVLDDQEVRDLWVALEEMPAPYAAFLRTLLLSGQRRDEVRYAQWQEIGGGLWTVPGTRNKTKRDLVIPITPAIETQFVKANPRREGAFIFSRDSGSRPLGSLSTLKRCLEAKIKARRGKPLANWRTHDLRRTARTLLSRAGVNSDISERVLGHVMPGVRGTYDRFAYVDEKRDALEKLAALIDRILHPDAAVVAFPKRPA
jgi:integrase